jgi:glycosyltransferase involved in cell wall biosynthesis
MAAGIPVIAANAGALSEYVTEEHGFLVPPGDYKTLTRFATTILQNPERATRMGFEGKEKVRVFDTENIIDTWETIYERAIH